MRQPGGEAAAGRERRRPRCGVPAELVGLLDGLEGDPGKLREQWKATLACAVRADGGAAGGTDRAGLFA